VRVPKSIAAAVAFAGAAGAFASLKTSTPNATAIAGAGRRLSHCLLVSRVLPVCWVG